MTSSAPRPRTKSCLGALAVPITWAPRALAICTATWPTPPAAAWMRTRSPAPTCAVSTSACHAVSATRRDRAGLHVVDRGGLRDERPRGADDVLRMGPGAVRVGEHTEDLVARCEQRDAEADLRDHSGHVPAQGVRRIAQEPAAGAVLPVRRVHARRLHPHEDLADAGSRARDLDLGEDLGPAVLLLAHGLHLRLIVRRVIGWCHGCAPHSWSGYPYGIAQWRSPPLWSRPAETSSAAPSGARPWAGLHPSRGLCERHPPHGGPGQEQPGPQHQDPHRHGGQHDEERDR